MDGKNFSKLCKDCGLIDKKFTLTDADLTFSKVLSLASALQMLQQALKVCRLICPQTLQVKTKGARKIAYAEFRKAVGAIASEKVEPNLEVLDCLRLLSLSF